MMSAVDPLRHAPEQKEEKDRKAWAGAVKQTKKKPIFRKRICENECGERDRHYEVVVC